MSIQVQKGTTAITTFETLEQSNGARVAPDSLPTKEYLHVNGVVNDAITVTIEQMQDNVPANITGYYKLSFPTTSLNSQDDVHVSVTTAINGTTVQKVFHFVIVNETTQIPVIR